MLFFLHERRTHNGFRASSLHPFKEFANRDTGKRAGRGGRDATSMIPRIIIIMRIIFMYVYIYNIYIYSEMCMYE